MGTIHSYTAGREKIEEIKKWVHSLGDVTPFLDFPHESSFAMSYLMMMEIGGPNDNLARHIFDSETKTRIDKGSLYAELIESDHRIGIKIQSRKNPSIELRHEGLSELCDISRSEIILFPFEVAKKLDATGIEPVLVKDWLISAAFSNFDPRVTDYRSQMSELLNNDAYLYTQLVSKKKLVFQTLHDVIEHATHASGKGWDQAQKTANDVISVFSKYFGSNSRGSVPSHILPFVIGVLVDDLTQSPFYGAAGRVAVINELLLQMQQLKIHAHCPKVLKQFPSSIESVLIMARKPAIENEPSYISKTVNQLVEDLYAFTH